MAKKDKRKRTEAPVPVTSVGAPVPVASTVAPEWAAAVTGRAGRRLAARLSGARMCFGKPVHAAGRTVVPVASVRGVGGLGFGRGDAAPSGDGDAAPSATDTPFPQRRDGGGGAGYLRARPLGFIEIGPAGVRYQPIAHPGLGGRALSAGMALLGGVLAGRRLGARGTRRRPPALRLRRATARPSLRQPNGR